MTAGYLYTFCSWSCETEFKGKMCKGLAGVVALPATCLKGAKDMKHRLGFLLQKTDSCEPLCCIKKEKRPLPPKVSQEEVKKWSEGLENLIASETGVSTFKAFLQSEYSEENIEFWIACEDYKKIKSATKLASKARKIYDDFVSVHAIKEVNLDSCTREETSQNLLEPTTSCFDTAQHKIFILMEKDSYRRFLKSSFYQDLIIPSDIRCKGSQKKIKACGMDHGQLIPQCA